MNHGPLSEVHASCSLLDVIRLEGSRPMTNEGFQSGLAGLDRRIEAQWWQLEQAAQARSEGAVALAVD